MGRVRGTSLDPPPRVDSLAATEMMGSFLVFRVAFHQVLHAMVRPLQSHGARLGADGLHL